MPYTEAEKTAMKEIAQLECFKEFSHDCMNDLTAALGNLYLLEKPESSVQAEMLRARIEEAINEAVKMFREVL
jgi:hypothetical protein